MPVSGIFVTLYDEDTVRLYVEKGIYGFLMRPVPEGGIPSRFHFRALADYACIREGTHVFFFLKRELVYGGEALGSTSTGSFYLNGANSPMAREAGAKLCWDESRRRDYVPSENPGTFLVPSIGEIRCQPYLVRFVDRIGLRGQKISSDELYFQLGKYGYPLPSNAIQGMSFCTMTPKETEIALSLLEGSRKELSAAGSVDRDLCLEGEPTLFAPEYGVPHLKDALVKSSFTSEAHLEMSVLANPELLPDELRPGENDAICRQVPISAFKPAQMDRADICYYSSPSVGDGTLPNAIIELKKDRAGKSAVNQVKRYLDWLYAVVPGEAPRVKVHLLAPSFARTVLAAESGRKYHRQLRLSDGESVWRL